MGFLVIWGLLGISIYKSYVQPANDFAELAHRQHQELEKLKAELAARGKVAAAVEPPAREKKELGSP